ncbi:MAG: sigma-70 family RNA polymerase sigma factor [Agathobacter sp.]
MTSSLVTKEEAWKESILKAQNGDKAERDLLVTANTGLVYMVLKRFSNRGHEQEDLFQIGVIGLMKAIDKFDVTREFSFSTYAVPMIIGEIRRFLRDDGIIHVSRQVKDNARRIAIVKEELKKTKNTDPTIEELVEATGLTVEEILMATQATTEVESIYQPVGNQSDGSKLLLADQLEDQQTGETDLINRITVTQMLNTLESKERRLIELRYLEGKTQTESAKILGMNQVAVSRLEKKILLFLRQQF